MLKPRDNQGSFYDADYICEQLIPQDSFYRKFREIVWPLIKDEDFESMYCKDNGHVGQGSVTAYFFRKSSTISMNYHSRLVGEAMFAGLLSVILRHGIIPNAED